ncbi:MAG: hypothetical protein SCALA702_07210 [Melioribacteraceae bacterium]|nr:MAG: hypothetical protein SCALA702_07210 [Melioribacteraceae bacterium]
MPDGLGHDKYQAPEPCSKLRISPVEEPGNVGEAGIDGLNGIDEYSRLTG